MAVVFYVPVLGLARVGLYCDL